MALGELKPARYITYERSYFDTISPWKDMKRVALAPDKTVIGYHHPDDTNKWEDGTPVNWTEYENNGWNCMVQIPKFYYKSVLGTVNGNKTFRWYISGTPADGFKVHPAFVRAGVEKDYIYFSAFEGSLINNKLRSLPNKSVTTNRTIVQFRSYAQANGEGWEQQDFLSTSAIQLLYLLEYGHFDSQTMIGQGRVNQSGYSTTGLSLSNGNKTFGNDQYMTYRGIENFWGNYWKWMDGINIKNREAFIADSNFVSNKFDGNYVSVGFVNASTNGTISDIGYSEICDFGFLPIEVNGSDNNLGLYDYYSQTSSGAVVAFGGRWDSGSSAGAFRLIMNNSASSSYSDQGARLICF